jgi:catechol 2,3-dioxygenase-like lactoylglutathione lyase family enzyme
MLSHVVLNTSNYEQMKQWYLTVLEATIGLETADHNSCFLRTDEASHRLGMFNVGATDDSVSMVQPGSSEGSVARVNHVAFEYPTLAKLLEAHARLAKESIAPVICLNYGPTMSMYYADPDKNTVELFRDNGLTEEELIEFYAGGERNLSNPIPFDPAAMLKELNGGKTVAELTAWAPPSE